MSSHDWRQWTPAAMPAGPRWRLIRFDRVDAEGKPIGRAIECRTPGDAVRTFPTEAVAQACANYLNAEAAEDTANA